MENLFELLVFFLIAAGVLQGFLRQNRARAGKDGRPAPPPEADWEYDEDDDAAERPATLEALIREELGINLERRPRVERQLRVEAPKTTPTSEPGPGRVAPSGIPSPTRLPPRSVGHPSRRREPERSVRRRAPAVTEPAAGKEAGTSLEEWGVRERGAAVSLEVPRAPDAHQRFHARYDVPQPPDSHEEFHQRYVDPALLPRRRRGRMRLPDSPRWSPVQKAIIWADVLGPPRGLTY